jgi:hypothetical protein
VDIRVEAAFVLMLVGAIALNFAENSMKRFFSLMVFGESQFQME